MMRCTMAVFAMCLGGASFVSADDAEAAKALTAVGAKVVVTKSAVTSVTIDDAAKLGDDDFRRITGLAQLKSLSMSGGLDDKRLAQLATLPNLEGLQTNVAQVTDDGLRPLAGVKSLRNLKFFHPGKSFSGSGLAYLAELPRLESVTVAGSFAFGDDGMAAVAKLGGLKELRTWHAGVTNDGVKKLTALKSLKSVHLGQRLAYKGPSCPNDETLAILAEMPSLETVIVEEARLSAAAVGKLKGLPALKTLKLAGIDMLKEDVDRLKAEMPKVKVEWTEPNEVYRKRIGALFGSK